MATPWRSSDVVDYDLYKSSVGLVYSAEVQYVYGIWKWQPNIDVQCSPRLNAFR